MFDWLIEKFTDSRWKCVVARPVHPKSDWFLVCYQHEITKRCKGYVDMGPGKGLGRFYKLERDVATGHVEEELRKCKP